MVNPKNVPVAAAATRAAAAALLASAGSRPPSPVLDLFPRVRPAPLPSTPPAATVPPPWSGR